MDIHFEKNENERLIQDQLRKKIKTLPIQIVPTPEHGKIRQGFTKCNLHFYQKQFEQSSLYSQNTQQQQEYVTLPLNYFNQLMMLALQNKPSSNQQQSTQLLQQKQQQQLEKYKKNNNYQELQNRSQSVTVVEQQNEPDTNKSIKDNPTQEQKQILILVGHQNNYIINHFESKILISQFFQDDQHYIFLFIEWIKQLEILTIEHYKLFLPIMNKELSPQDQLPEQFKKLFTKLLFEYFTKHAFCDIIKNNSDEAEDIVNQVNTILKNIMTPKDYYKFSL